MENLPLYVGVVFAFATALTVFLFYRAANRSTPVLALILIWLAVQSIVSLRGFYTVTSTMPPRFSLLVVPPFLLIATLFLTARGKKFIDGLRPEFLTLLHTVRIAVELVLFWLFLYKAVPQIMTFEGRNLDILSGLTAPIVFYFCFVKKSMGNKSLLLWNLVCLALLVNVVSIAVLSVPFPFQKFAFGQPNVAVLHFPFVWLPCCIVPLVLFSHLATIRQLLLSLRKTTADNYVAVTNV